MEKTKQKILTAILFAISMVVVLAVLLGWWESRDRRWIALLESGDPGRIKVGAEALAENGSVVAIPHFLDVLSRLKTSWAFETRGGQAGYDLDLIFKPAGRRQDTGSVEVAVLLYSSLSDLVRKAGEGAVPGLVGGLRHRSENMRCLSGFLLSRLGPHARSAVGDLGKAIDDREGMVQDFAALALSRIGKPAIPVLREAVKRYPFPNVVHHALGDAESHPGE